MAALACAASMFAVDISSTVKMDATLAKKNGDNADFLTLNSKDQKDGDALIFSANGEKAGAQFQLWYNYNGKDKLSAETTAKAKSEKDLTLVYTTTVAGTLQVRNVNLWFKPVDMLKVNVGDTSISSYKERIFWWHGVYGAAPGTWGAFGGDYLAGNGVKVELNPIEGLSLAGAILPGVGKAWVTSGVDGYGAYAASAKYAFGPASATVIFADKGKGEQKLLGIGGDFSSNGFYAFANVTLNMKDGVQGVAIDNYEEYSTGALKVQAHLPVVIYKDSADWKVGMYATLKASYGIGGFTPYFLATTEPDGDNGWVLDSTFGDKFAMTFQPGVTFSVGSASFDVAFRADVTKADGLADWKVPVAISVGL